MGCCDGQRGPVAGVVVVLIVRDGVDMDRLDVGVVAVVIELIVVVVADNASVDGVVVEIVAIDVVAVVM